MSLPSSLHSSPSFPPAPLATPPRAATLAELERALVRQNAELERAWADFRALAGRGSVSVATDDWTALAASLEALGAEPGADALGSLATARGPSVGTRC